MQTIDRMGGGLATTSKDVEMVKGQVAELKTLVLSNLVALQYIIGQYPSLAEWFKTNGFDVYQMTVNDFLKFLATRIPR